MIAGGVTVDELSDERLGRLFPDELGVALAREGLFPRADQLRYLVSLTGAERRVAVWRLRRQATLAGGRARSGV
jgi:hypothetical protein